MQGFFLLSLACFVECDNNLQLHILIFPHPLHYCFKKLEEDFLGLLASPVPSDLPDDGNPYPTCNL